jgi:hypothetical protein
MFPTGKFTDWFCSPEIQKAAELGYKIEIHYGYHFHRAKIFTEYVDHFYAIKENSAPDSVDYLFSKLMMNSLYGKFGQRREKESVVINPTSTIGLVPIDAYGKLGIYKKAGESNAAYILPAIASFVTSYARLCLFNLMKDHDPIYCDTDSIITKDVLPTGKKLGELKREYRIQEAVFLRPKVYAIKQTTTMNDFLKEGMRLLPDKVRAKGFFRVDCDCNKTSYCELCRGKGRREAFDFLTLKQCLFSGDYSKIVQSINVMATTKAALRRTNGYLAVLKASKSIKSAYDKRIVTENFKTDPVFIDDKISETENYIKDGSVKVR